MGVIKGEQDQKIAQIYLAFSYNDVVIAGFRRVYYWAGIYFCRLDVRLGDIESETKFAEK